MKIAVETGAAIESGAGDAVGNDAESAESRNGGKSKRDGLFALIGRRTKG